MELSDKQKANAKKKEEAKSAEKARLEKRRGKKGEQPAAKPAPVKEAKVDGADKQAKE